MKTRFQYNQFKFAQNAFPQKFIILWEFTSFKISQSLSKFFKFCYLFQDLELTGNLKFSLAHLNHKTKKVQRTKLQLSQLPLTFFKLFDHLRLIKKRTSRISFFSCWKKARNFSFVNSTSNCYPFDKIWNRVLTTYCFSERHTLRDILNYMNQSS